MLTPLTDGQKTHIDSLLGALTPEQKIAQTLSWVALPFGKRDFSDERMALIGDCAEKYQLGSVFLAHADTAAYKKVEQALRGRTKVPVIINSDLTYGPGCRLSDATVFPHTMAAGAAGSEELVEAMGESVAHEGRACGTHWTLAPMVDLVVNTNNPMMICRAFGSDPDHVLRLSRAFIRGVQKNGYMAAAPKHFPGDGVEDRDPHVCTVLNTLSRDHWMKTYGRVWRQIIDDGAMSIMTGHIGLPFMDPGTDYLGPPPATLSRKIQLDLLREEMGFDGVIVTDAVSMGGFTSQAGDEDRGWRILEAGGDCILFGDPEIDLPHMMQAFKDNQLSEARLDFAVRKMLELKARVGLFDGLAVADPTEAELTKYAAASNAMTRRSIAVVRDATNVLPVTLAKGAKVLTVTLSFKIARRHDETSELEVVDEELRKRGFDVDNELNLPADRLKQRLKDYDAVFINMNVPPRYGTNKFVGPPAKAMSGSVWRSHPRVVITAFGDPFKLYEMPFAQNMVLTFSNSAASQRQAVKVWLGEDDPLGKPPVSLPPYFEASVS
ncbi:MAG: hypothetical protein JXR37_05225 [Kiritimatiellae bacterium]|nr:hypothetical protein [Kiritimatiellia bacterium]